MIVRANKALNDEIVDLEDRLYQEKQSQVDIRATKDKLDHQLYKWSEDLTKLRVKTEDLEYR